MQQPPLLPEHVLARVQSVARRNGLSVLLFAGLFAVLEAARGSVLTAVVGVLVAGTGAMEVHGGGLLRDGAKRGLSWAIRAELLLLAVVWIFCGYRLVHPDLAEMREAFHASLQLPIVANRWAELQQLGITEDQYLGLTHQLTNIGVAFVTLIYQGGMVIYYARRQKAVDLALPEE